MNKEDTMFDELDLGVSEDYFDYMDDFDDSMRDLQEFNDKLDLEDYNWGMM